MRFQQQYIAVPFGPDHKNRPYLINPLRLALKSGNLKEKKG